MGVGRIDREPLEQRMKDETCVCGMGLTIATDPASHEYMLILRCPRCGTSTGTAGNLETKAKVQASPLDRFRRRGIEALNSVELMQLERDLQKKLRRATDEGKSTRWVEGLLTRLRSEMTGTAQGTAIVKAETRQAVTYTPAEIEIIKQQIAPGVSDDELRLFVATSQRRGLDPFARQIYAVVRKSWNPRTKQEESKMVMQTGIDGLRLIAARTAGYAGQDDIEFGPMVTDPPELGGVRHPEWAKATVYRIVQGHRVPFSATVWWDERVQTVTDSQTKAKKPNSMWTAQPRGQLGKCAEALALRKAAPEEMSGLEYAEARPDVIEGAYEEVGAYSDGVAVHSFDNTQNLEAADAPAPQTPQAVNLSTGEVVSDATPGETPKALAWRLASELGHSTKSLAELIDYALGDGVNNAEKPLTFDRLTDAEQAALLALLTEQVRNQRLIAVTADQEKLAAF